eukprot:scaffold51605_cov64-Phaeocystis_antarctica.AAC.10
MVVGRNARIPAMKTERVTEASKTGYSYFHSSATASAFCIAAGTSTTNKATMHAQTATAHKHKMSGAAPGDEEEGAAAAEGALARAARMRGGGMRQRSQRGIWPSSKGRQARIILAKKELHGVYGPQTDRLVRHPVYRVMWQRRILSQVARRARRARSRAADPRGSTSPVRSSAVLG